MILVMRCYCLIYDASWWQFMLRDLSWMSIGQSQNNCCAFSAAAYHFQTYLNELYDNYWKMSIISGVAFKCSLILHAFVTLSCLNWCSLLEIDALNTNLTM